MPILGCESQLNPPNVLKSLVGGAHLAKGGESLGPINIFD